MSNQQGASRAYSMDIAGQKFGLLTAVAPLGGGRLKWLVRCDCGTEKAVQRDNLRAGRTRSCGCLAEAASSATGLRNKTHGLTNSPEYVTWDGMLARCYRPKTRGFDKYGGRGITVCDRWRESFADFYADMGQRPSPKHSIDRFPNKDGNYEPGNCRWADALEQGRNKANNRVIEWAGVSLPLVAWAERIGMRADSLAARLNKGWPVERALTAPVASRTKRNQGAQQ